MLTPTGEKGVGEGSWWRPEPRASVVAQGLLGLQATGGSGGTSRHLEAPVSRLGLEPRTYGLTYRTGFRPPAWAAWPLRSGLYHLPRHDPLGSRSSSL